MNTTVDKGLRPTGGIEMLWASLATIALLLAVFGATGLLHALSSPPNLDETHTMAFGQDPSLIHAIWGLAHGTDTNAPLGHIFIWVSDRVLGASFVASRMPSMIAGVLAAVGLYAITRQANIRIAPAAVASLTVLSHAMVMYQTTNCRFYECWLAATVWSAFFISRRAGGQFGAISAAGLGISTIAMCTTHYFGVLLLALMVLAFFAANRWSPIAFLLRVLWPTTMGLIALAACVPMILMQRASLSVGTWIPPLSLAQLRDGLAPLVKWPLLILAIVAADRVVMAMWRRSHPAPSATSSVIDRDTINWKALVAPLSLLAMPLVVGVFSIVQPSFIDRYMLPFVIGSAVLTGILLNRASRVTITAVGLLCVLAMGYRARHLTQVMEHSRVRYSTMAELIAARPDIPVTGFGSRFDIYPLWMMHPELTPRLKMIDVTPRTLPPGVAWGRLSQLEHDMSQHFSVIYDAPGMITVNQLRQRGAFILLRNWEDPSAEADLTLIHAILPEFSAEAVAFPQGSGGEAIALYVFRRK